MSAAQVAAGRKRPKDRKAQIARAAAEAFSAVGFHAVSMESIAARVGVSATALYRHYPSKYQLFRGAVLSLGARLVEATGFADDIDADAAGLDRVVDALIEVTLANRESGGLYRWEARYLRAEDQAALMDQIRVVNRRIQRLLVGVRPALTSSQLWMLSSGALSVIGSIADHRAKAPAEEIRAVLAAVAAGVLSADLPEQGIALPPPKVRRLFHATGAGTYESLLHAAMTLFDAHGYRETSMEQIAAAAGIPVSGIYRYFEGKSDILATAMRRAADRVSAELAAVLDTAAGPRALLVNLIDAYVSLSFANPELALVYYTERPNLSEQDQLLLRNVQRGTVDSWVRLLVAARPDMPSTEARFRVHASMALVVDVGRLVRYDDSAHSQACVRRLMELTLIGA